jgi:hypothetical protein
MLRRLTALAAAAVVVPLAGATTAHAAPSGSTWRVTEATHASSATLTAPDESARSAVSWRLAPPTSTAPNRLVVGAPGPLVSGYGVVNVRGRTEMESVRRTRCTLAGASGDRDHPGEVPVPITLNLSAAPGGGLQVALAARYAHLGSMYFGSECSVHSGRPPSDPVMKVTRLPASALRGKRIVLTWRGSGGSDGASVRWSTRIVLKRLR